MLTAYLMQEQLAGPVADLMGWMQWVRRIVPASAEPSAAKRRRGQDVCFAGCLRHPDLLIRALDLRGSGRLGGQSFELAGTLTDVSNRPALCSQPMRLKLTTTGSLQVQAQATIDRTGPVAKDQFLVDCGGIVLPKLQLGRSDKLRLSIAPSTATLNISVTLEGDKLSGDVQLVQKQVQIMPSVGEELDRFQVVEALEDSLRDIHMVATRVSLSGTLDRPQFELWSNLGPAVAEAMNHTDRKSGNDLRAAGAGRIAATRRRKAGGAGSSDRRRAGLVEAAIDGFDGRAQAARGRPKRRHEKPLVARAIRSAVAGEFVVSIALSACVPDKFVRQPSKADLLFELADARDQVDGAAAVAPFVVVPAEDLEHRAADDLRPVGGEDRAVGIADDVGRNERIFRVGEDALQRPFGGGLHGRVDFFLRDFFLHDASQVDDAAGRNRHTQRDAGELAFELGNHEADGARGAGRARNDVERAARARYGSW